MSFESDLQGALDKRRAQNLYRQRATIGSAQSVSVLRNGQSVVSFCSNDYLGLANHPRVIEAFAHSAQQYGVGSGASHLVCGHSHEHQKLEEELALFTGRPRALLFSTGYMANTGVINALCGRADAVFEDKLNHASLLDGGLLSSAQFIRFNHNDMHHLERRLINTDAERKLIVTDGVFSMDGDMADLNRLKLLSQKYNAQIMVDDAHGFGCLGRSGGGCIELLGLSVDDVPILMGTLGKAFGTFGAFVAGSEALIEYLIQFSRSYIYTTALPPAVAAATRMSLKILQQEHHRRQNLESLITQFKLGCKSIGVQLMPSDSPIQPIVVGDAERAMNISNYLLEKGFWVTAIRPPTVAQGTSRLRVTFTAEHKLSQVESLLVALADACKAFPY